MPKDTKTLCIKKGCASVLTQPLLLIVYYLFTYRNHLTSSKSAS